MKNVFLALSFLVAVQREVSLKSFAQRFIPTYLCHGATVGKGAHFLSNTWHTSRQLHRPPYSNRRISKDSSTGPLNACACRSCPSNDTGRKGESAARNPNNRDRAREGGQMRYSSFGLPFSSPSPPFWGGFLSHCQKREEFALGRTDITGA